MYIYIIYINSTSFNSLKSCTFRYLYTDEICLHGNNVLDCLYAAKKYALDGLVHRCSQFLERSLDTSNVCAIYEQAVFYDIVDLQVQCIDYIAQYAAKVFEADTFLKISRHTLNRILQLDSLKAEEIVVFRAARRWAEKQCTINKKEVAAANLRNCLGDTIRNIRFPVMSMQHFAREVTPSGILTSDDQVMLYQYIATKDTSSQSIVGKFCGKNRNSGSFTVAIPNSITLPFPFTGNEFIVTLIPTTDIKLHALHGPLVQYISSIQMSVQMRKEHPTVNRGLALTLHVAENWEAEEWQPLFYTETEGNDIVFALDPVIIKCLTTKIMICAFLSKSGGSNNSIERGARRNARVGRKSVDQVLLVKNTQVEIRGIPPGINQISFR